MPPRFSTRTNKVTVSNLPIFRTLRGRLVTNNGSPVRKQGNLWYTTNNNKLLSNAINYHWHRGMSTIGLTHRQIMNEYKRLKST